MHIWVVIQKNNDGAGFDTRVYVYAAVTATVKDVLLRIKQESSRITKAYILSGLQAYILVVMATTAWMNMETNGIKVQC